MRRAGDLFTFPCPGCGTTLETAWEPRNREVASGTLDFSTVLEASAWCPRCLEERTVYDPETLGVEQHTEFVHDLCGRLENSGAWIFTDEDREDLERAAVRLGMGDWEDVETFIRLYADRHPRRLLCFHTGLYGEVDGTPGHYAEVFLFVPGQPGPAFVPLVVVQTEAARRRDNAENRRIAPEAGFIPYSCPPVDLDEHIVSIRTPQAGPLAECDVESGVRRFLRALMPQLEHFPIEWLPCADA